MDQTIKNAEAKLELLSSDAETIALYRAREATLHERANMINSAKEEAETKKSWKPPVICWLRVWRYR
jgi:hypothetical protein